VGGGRGILTVLLSILRVITSFLTSIGVLLLCFGVALLDLVVPPLAPSYVLYSKVVGELGCKVHALAYILGPWLNCLIMSSLGFKSVSLGVF